MMNWLAFASAATSGSALVGCAAMLAACWATMRFSDKVRAMPPAVPAEPVTVLKPLHGAEPQLTANLASFANQQWAAPVQIVAGVQSHDDGAIGPARALGAAVDLVIDAQAHGANAKIGNLINMMPVARHDLIVLSDSDIVAPPDYLARITAALAQPGVGAVTCAYAGRGDAGFWSVLGAAMLSYHFLPSVLLSVALGAGDVCMGSTIALTRDTLADIGGFERFADTLADDYAIGEGVRALGKQVVLAPVLVTHASIEPSLTALVAHELRWAATVRDLRPAGQIGATVLHPLPFALAGLALAPGWFSGSIVIAVLTIRWTLAAMIDRLAGRKTAPHWMLPVRDLLSFGIHIASFFVRSVEWRGARLRMRAEGRIEAKQA